MSEKSLFFLFLLLGDWDLELEPTTIGGLGKPLKPSPRPMV